MENILDKELAERFEDSLRSEEKSAATIEKYLRDINNFLVYAGEGTVLTKETVISRMLQSESMISGCSCRRKQRSCKTEI